MPEQSTCRGCSRCAVTDNPVWKTSIQTSKWSFLVWTSHGVGGMFEFDFEYLEEEESPREKFQPGVFLKKNRWGRGFVIEECELSVEFVFGWGGVFSLEKHLDEDFQVVWEVFGWLPVKGGLVHWSTELQKKNTKLPAVSVLPKQTKGIETHQHVINLCLLGWWLFTDSTTVNQHETTFWGIQPP